MPLTDTRAPMAIASILSGNAMVTMIAVISRTRPAAPPWFARQGRQNAATLTPALTRRGCVIEITTVRTIGMRAKLCVITKRAALEAFAVRQGIVFLRVGAVMARMTAVTVVMKCCASMTTAHVKVTSLLVGTVSIPLCIKSVYTTQSITQLSYETWARWSVDPQPMPWRNLWGFKVYI